MLKILEMWQKRLADFLTNLVNGSNKRKKWKKAGQMN